MVAWVSTTVANTYVPRQGRCQGPGPRQSPYSPAECNVEGVPAMEALALTKPSHGLAFVFIQGHAFPWQRQW